MKKRILSLLMAGMILLTMPGINNLFLVNVRADEEAEETEEVKTVETITIASEQDLLDIADLSRTQEYSTGKIFSLSADLDMTEYPNFTIPYIDGVFNGNGHSIIGISLNEELSDYGLFRYVGENAVIKNLTVYATITAGEEQENIGIIAGNNCGTIADCVSVGSVDGQSQVGGIVGYNEEYATIKNCTNEAAVNGKYQTGGIVGENLGTVSGCTNLGLINGNAKVLKSDIDADGSAVNISIPNAVTGLAADDRANETGGIAGYSEGKVYDCVNKGIIGFEHLGSSTGGVIGRLYGKVQNCSNEATVYGHKNVGGIVGYFEPYEAFEYDTDYVQQLKDQLEELSDIVDDVASSGEALGDNFASNADILSDEIKNLRSTLQEYGDGYSYDFDAARGSIRNQTNEIKDIVDDMDYDFQTKKLAKRLDRLKRDADKMLEIIAQLRKIAEKLAAEDYEAYLKLMATIEQYEALAKQYLEILQRLLDILGKIPSAPTISSNSAKATKETIVSELEYNGAAPGQSADTGVLTGLTPEEIELIKKLIAQLDEYNADAQNQIDAINDIINDWPEELDDVKDDLKGIRDASGKAYGAMNDFLDRIDARTDLLREDMKNQGDDISNTVDLTKDQMEADWDRLTDSIRKLKDKAKDLRETITDGYDEIRDRIEDNSIYVDISELADIKGGVSGRILSCNNSGEIYADSLAGGIAGSIDKEDASIESIDVLNDFIGFAMDRKEEEEDDEKEDGDKKDAITKHVEAVVYDCKNTADVNTDTDYAGGIVGRARYGYIQECYNFGDVAVDDGKYVGGIVGFSKLAVDNSYVLGGLYGKSYVGGIAGRGNNITNSYCCVYMDMGEEYSKAAGSIAGKANGIVGNNYFVDNGVGAVDGVTKIGEASAVTYEKMLSLKQMPREFKEFTIRFIDEDEVIWSDKFLYGDEFSEDKYPELTKKEGEYVYWEDKQLSPVCRNVTIHAIRRVFVPSIQAHTVENEGSKPDILFGGNFYPDSVLSVSNENKSSHSDADATVQGIVNDIHYVVTQVYHYNVYQEEEFDGKVSIRAKLDSLLPANRLLVVDENFNAVTDIVAAQKIGSFMAIDANIPADGYIIEINKVSNITVVAVVVALIVILALIIIILIFARRGRKKLTKKIKNALAETEKPLEEIRSIDDGTEQEDILNESE